MAGTEIADRQAVAGALRDAFAGLPRAVCDARIAMRDGAARVSHGHHYRAASRALPRKAAARKTAGMNWPNWNRR